tara:strand:- start:17181 stop:18344 length:1164 start_codon:yes stop_codon:yes gene_type:complete
VLKINNNDIRNLWLSSMGLSSAPTGSLDVLKIIKELGFVQLDTIQNVSRAHHHILWSRNQNYREAMLDELLGSKRDVFEHFTHDASIIPMDYYPMWTRQFGRLKKWLDSSKRFQQILAHADLEDIQNRIEQEGPLSTHAFDTEIVGKKKMWSRPPHKVALDYLWYSGELATSHREKFKKFYDLPHRVIPVRHRNHNPPDDEQINWLCNAALDRMSFGALKDIQNFWDATHKDEVNRWYKDSGSDHRPIQWQTADGSWIDAVAATNIEQRLANLTHATSRLRILNPFDPAIRDRVRLKNLFGFDYKIEIFVPAAKRKWGYYVYPILEEARFVGRIELKADRKKNTLNVINFWQEPGIKWGSARQKKLNAELDRLTRFVGLDTVNWPAK